MWEGTREVLWPWVCVKGAQPSVAMGTGQGFGGMKGGWNKRKKPGLGPTFSQFSVCHLCPDSGAQPGGVPSAPTGPLGPPGHGQTLGKNEVISVG